jgi:hypothetical protein
VSAPDLYVALKPFADWGDYLAGRVSEPSAPIRQQDYFRAAAAFAQAMETRRAETVGLGAEHDSAVAESDAPNLAPKDIPDRQEG